MKVLGRLLPCTMLLVLVAALDVAAQDTVVVRSVESMNTIVLESGTRVRLLGVGIARSRTLDPFVARDHLAAIVEGRTVVLVNDGSVTKGGRRSTRTCYVYFDGSLINLELIEDGMATATPTKHSRLEEFRQAEERARRLELAAWSSESHLSSRCTARKGRTRCAEMTRHISGRCEKHR